MIFQKKQYTNKELIKIWTEKSKERSTAKYVQDVYEGHIEKYLREYLKQILEVCNRDLDSTPLMYDINICKAVVKKEAILYQSPLDRDFLNVSDSEKSFLKDFYANKKINNIALQINRLVRLLGGVLVAFDGDEIKIITKKNYIKLDDIFLFSISESEISHTVADKSFYAYSVSSGELYFCDKKGVFSSVDSENLFIFEISKAENELDSGLASYTVSVNASLTDIKNTIHHQAFAQPFIKTNAENVPSERINVGKSEVVHLKTSADGSSEEFGFITPNADIGGAIDYIKLEASLFAQSRGLAMNDIIGSESKKSFTSALDRLLSMADDYKTATEDKDFMIDFENNLFNAIILIYGLNSEASLSITYYEPEITRTISEKIDDNLKLESIGAQTRRETIAKIKDISIDSVDDDLINEAQTDEA